LRREVGSQAREFIIILRQGFRLGHVMSILGLKPDAFTRAVTRKVIMIQEISREFGVEDPYRLRTNPPVVLVDYGTAGLVGRYLNNMILVRVLCFRLGTEKEGMVGLREHFTKPKLVKVLFR
jgi:hypothetical protein